MSNSNAPHAESIRKFEQLRGRLDHRALLTPDTLRAVTGSREWEAVVTAYLAEVKKSAEPIDRENSQYGLCAQPRAVRIATPRWPSDDCEELYLVHVTGSGRSCIMAGAYGSCWAWSLTRSELDGPVPHAYGLPPETLRSGIIAAYGSDPFCVPEVPGAAPSLPAELIGWTLADLEDEVPEDQDFELNVESLSDFFLSTFADPGTGEQIERTATVVRLDSWGRVLHRFDGRPGEERPANEWGKDPRWVVSIIKAVGAAIPEQVRVRANPAHADVLRPRIRSISPDAAEIEATINFAHRVAERIATAEEEVERAREQDLEDWKVVAFQRLVMLAECEAIGLAPILRRLAGDGVVVWRHGEDESEAPAPDGATLEESWAVADQSLRTWYPSVQQARCAMLALAIDRHCLDGVAGDAVDLTPPHSQFGSRAWVKEV